MDRNIKLWRWVNTGMFLAMVTLNILANVLPIGAGNTGYISASFPTAITPAPFTFAIWGVIYILMAVFILYQWSYHGRDMVVSVGPLFAVSCMMNIAWILAWHHMMIWLSVAAIAALLLSLSVLQSRLSRAKDFGFIPRTVLAGFDLYAGWVTAATILNISVALVSSGWNRFGLPEGIWTGIILIVGAIIGSLPVLIKRRYYSTVAVIWAYIGIIARQVNVISYTEKESTAFGFSVLGIVMMSFAIFYAMLMERSGCRILHPKAKDKLREEPNG